MGYVKNGMVLFPIPTELLEEVGLDEMDVIQMSVSDNKLIIEKADTDGFICDGDCRNCPCSGSCDEGENNENL